MFAKIFKIILFAFGIFLLILVLYWFYSYRNFEDRLAFYSSQEFKEQQQKRVQKLDDMYEEVTPHIENLNNEIYSYSSLYFGENSTNILTSMSKGQRYAKNSDPDFFISDNNTDFLISYMSWSIVQDIIQYEDVYLWRLVFYGPDIGFWWLGCDWYVFEKSYRRLRGLIDDWKHYNWYINWPYSQCPHAEIGELDVRKVPDVKIFSKF